VATEYVLRKLGFKAAGSGKELQADELIITSDIGCYTLGVYPPLAALDTCACMGASIGQALGLEKAGVPNKIVAVLGDSTFMHSGITGLIDVVYNQVSTTVIILDNETTAMTGHQGHPGTGISARGDKVRRVEMESLARGIGIEDVNVVSAFDVATLEATIKRSININQPSVIISRGSCPLAVRAKSVPYNVDTDLCVGCFDCMDLGCPALIIADDVVRIDVDVCGGCGVCAQVCAQEAIAKG
jgi:indolepyruvate ferredoxin oxidoreductase alpha subunit